MNALNNMSIFIPHVFPQFTQEYVAKSFSGIGDVKRVDFVPKRHCSGKHYNAAYVHFKEFINTKAYAMFEEKMLRDGQIKYYHDDISDNYWIVLPNMATKYVSGDRKQRVGLGELKSVNSRTPEKQEVPSKPDKLQPEPAPVMTREEAYMSEFFINGISIKEWESREEAKLLAEAFEQHDQMMNELSQEELEKLICEDDKPLITIDTRYVATLEQDNEQLRREVIRLNMIINNMSMITSVDL